MGGQKSADGIVGLLDQADGLKIDFPHDTPLAPIPLNPQEGYPLPAFSMRHTAPHRERCHSGNRVLTEIHTWVGKRVILQMLPVCPRGISGGSDSFLC